MVISMDILDFIIGIMYIVALGCILYCINKSQMCKLKRDSKPINKVHFYLARNKCGDLWLYFRKPIRLDDKFIYRCTEGVIALGCDDYLKSFGLNKNDYDYLKWEDEPVEVFLNLED